MRPMTRNMLMVLVPLLFMAAAALNTSMVTGTVNAQAIIQPSFTRVNYEVGLKYDDPVGTFASPCYSDNFGLMAFWGDNMYGFVTKNAPDTIYNGVHTIAPGSYTFSTDHIYTTAKSYIARVANSDGMQCYGGNHFGLSTGDVAITVYPRGMVKTVHASREFPIQSGGSVDVKISLKSPAQASGTRVFLKVDKPGLLDNAFIFPQYVDVLSSDYTEKIITLHFKAGLAAATALTITATAGGAPQTDTFNVNP